jgi:hypothetical protein
VIEATRVLVETFLKPTPCRTSARQRAVTQGAAHPLAGTVPGNTLRLGYSWSNPNHRRG